MQQQHQEASALDGSSQAGACRIFFWTERKIFWTAAGARSRCKARIGRERLSRLARVHDWPIGSFFLPSLPDWPAVKPVPSQYLFCACLIIEKEVVQRYRAFASSAY
jgi:hypothetical protein